MRHLVRWVGLTGSSQQRGAPRSLANRLASLDNFRATARQGEANPRRSAMTFSDAPACALHAELRRATRQAHRDLDRHPVLLPLTGSATLPEYQRALGAMYAITAPVESRVGAYLDARRPRLDYQVRRRMPNLMRDLEFYGLTPPGPAWSGPAIATDGELVGCLYVLEGGTRGSRFIFQRMTMALGITEVLGGRFFSGYGDHTESTWQEFWSFAAEHCPPESWAEACQTAVTLLHWYQNLLDNFQDR